jgi:hypothetical protein
MTRVHELKTWPSFFEAIARGEKRHEVRAADRDFAVGDTLKLLEWDPEPLNPGTHYKREYTGRRIDVRVTYVTTGGSWGLPASLLVMSVVPITTVIGRYEAHPESHPSVDEAQLELPDAIGPSLPSEESR